MAFTGLLLCFYDNEVHTHLTSPDAGGPIPLLCPLYMIRVYDLGFADSQFRLIWPNRVVNGFPHIY